MGKDVKHYGGECGVDGRAAEGGNVKDYAEIIDNLRQMHKMYSSLASITGWEDWTRGLYGEAADAIQELLDRDRWISVEERLPEPKTDVLAAWDDGAVWSIWQAWANDNDKDKFLYYVDMGASVHEVTHWRPLPEPPKEET